MTVSIGVIALIVTAVVTPAVGWFGVRFGLVDMPNVRSMHTRPTPRSGGIAVMLGMAAALIVAHALGRDVPWALLVIALILAAVGLADDRLHISALYRLVVQAAAGAVAGALVGSVWWAVVGVVALPVAVNMINFMDGINSITCLTVLVWSLSTCLAGLSSGQPGFVAAGVALAGACLGFLPWNAPKGRVFLGDGGSYALGALVGIGTVTGVRDAVPPALLIAPLVLYLADTGTTLLRRALRGEPLLEPHRSHVYQRLIAATGWPHLAVGLMTAGGAAVMTAAWWVPGYWPGVVVTAVVVAVYLASPMLVGAVLARKKEPA